MSYKDINPITELLIPNGFYHIKDEHDDLHGNIIHKYYNSAVDQFINVPNIVLNDMSVNHNGKYVEQITGSLSVLIVGHTGRFINTNIIFFII